MKLEEILSEWSGDANIDRTNLYEEILSIPSLHHKYWRIFVEEAKLLRQYEAALKELRHQLYEFYTLGPNDDTPETWELPPQGRIVIKAEAQSYVDKHPDYVKMILRIGVQKDKTDLLQSIIDSFKSRGFNIKAAMEYERFKNGV